MSLLVVGSVAVDSVQTPHGKREKALGGAAVYCSYASSFFTDVRLVGVIGKDFPDEYMDVLKERPIDLEGLEVHPEGKTFHWTGQYEGDMNAAETLHVELNVLADFNPKLSDKLSSTEYVFLANTAPQTQLSVLKQCTSCKLSVCDTMNFWIQSERPALEELLKEVDGIVLNDEEARMLTEEDNLPPAGQKILEMGPRFVVIKKGEHGALMMVRGEENPDELTMFAMPSLPMLKVVDPTGAGDSFAGGMMGYLAQVGQTGPEQLKRALAYGTVMASINIQGFSLDRFRETTNETIEQRYHVLSRMLQL